MRDPKEAKSNMYLAFPTGIIARGTAIDKLGAGRARKKGRNQHIVHLFS